MEIDSFNLNCFFHFFLLTEILQKLVSTGFGQKLVLTGFRQKLGPTEILQKLVLTGFGQKLGPTGFGQKLVLTGFRQKLVLTGFRQVGLHRIWTEVGLHKTFTRVGFYQKSYRWSRNEQGFDRGDFLSEKSQVVQRWYLLTTFLYQPRRNRRENFDYLKVLFHSVLLV